MLGVLHLHPVSRDFQTTRCLELLVKNLGPEFPMASLSIGHGGDFRNLPEAILRLRFDPRRHTHAAQAWGPAELLAAVAGGFSRIIFSPQGKIHQKWSPWINRLLRHRPIEVVCPTSWVKDAFISQGVPASRCRAIFPALDLARFNGVNRQLRAKLGLADSDIVLLAPGESVREAGHGASIWSAAILNTLDPKWRLLVWGRGPMLGSLRHFARSSKLDRLLVRAEERLREPVDLEDLVSAADAAVVFSEHGSPVLPVAACMAANLPIIASRTAELGEFLQDKDTASIQEDSNPRDVAQRTLNLSNNSALRERLIKGARKEVANRFAPDRFITDWRTVYNGVLD